MRVIEGRIDHITRGRNHASGAPCHRLAMTIDGTSAMYRTADTQFAYEDVTKFEGKDVLAIIDREYRVRAISERPIEPTTEHHLYWVAGTSGGNVINMYLRAPDTASAYAEAARMLDPDNVRETLLFVERSSTGS
jgi:hypothetical protein